MPFPFNQNFAQGAEMAFRGMGIRDQRQKNEMLNKLYESQMATAELQRKKAQQEMDRRSKYGEQMVAVTRDWQSQGQDPFNFPGAQERPDYGQLAEQMIPVEMQFGEPSRGIDLMKQLIPGDPKETPEEKFKRQLELATFKEDLIRKRPEKVSTGKVPSMGNVSELAIARKFKDPSYLTDPEKSKVAMAWLDTPEGRHALMTARDEMTSPAVTFLQTEQGYVPVTTRGSNIGAVGQPTGLNKPLTSEMVVAQQQIGTLKETLERVKKTYKSSYVGAVGGRWGGLMEKTLGVETDQAKFYSDVAQIKNSLIYLLSGKQINQTEYKRLLDQLPSRELPSGVFEARMENFERTVNSIIANRQKGMGGYGKQGQPIQDDPLGIR